MSEKSSEYHKKTCIICGCHTNQTINIYEPRSGPNIVRLIQARFKFQPLNEDKYLCYSCNNWLINWHSLQALNSNDADNSSGTFRSSHMNNMVSEKGSPSETKHNMTNCTKPVAQVRPLPHEQPESNDSNLPKRTCHSTNTKSNGYYFSKRTFLSWHRIKKSRRRSFHVCCVCGRTILRKVLATGSSSKLIAVKCKRCREILHWRHLYLKTSMLRSLTKPKSLKQNHEKLVSETSIHTSMNPPTSHLPYQPQRYQRPLVDGKVVSMLRRLGTTLSRDTTTVSNAYQPPIMSPTKNKSQRWTRDIADDEILINFDTAITEVLPIRHIRRKLTYQVSDTTLDAIEINSSDEEEEEKDAKMGEKANCEVNLKHVYSLVPKGLTVSLIPSSEPIHVN